MENMEIGKIIKEQRKKAKLTQKKLGELSKTSETTIKQYESGKRQPKIEQLQRIARVLGIDVNELIPDDEKEVSEYDNYSWASCLNEYKTFIECDIFQYTDEEKKLLLSVIEEAINKGTEIEDKQEYYFNLEVKLSHRIMDDLLKPYNDAIIMDLAELIGYFLSLNENGQNKIIEYEDDLFYNKYYKVRKARKK